MAELHDGNQEKHSWMGPNIQEIYGNDKVEVHLGVLAYYPMGESHDPHKPIEILLHLCLHLQHH